MYFFNFLHVCFITFAANHILLSNAASTVALGVVSSNAKNLPRIKPKIKPKDLRRLITTCTVVCKSDTPSKRTDSICTAKLGKTKVPFLIARHADRFLGKMTKFEKGAAMVFKTRLAENGEECVVKLAGSFSDRYVSDGAIVAASKHEVEIFKGLKDSESYVKPVKVFEDRFGNPVLVLPKYDFDFADYLTNSSKSVLERALMTLGVYGPQLVTAIEDLHSQGYIYRDLKPANIVLDKKRQKVKLIDFGLTIQTKDFNDMVPRGTRMYIPRELLVDKSFPNPPESFLLQSVGFLSERRKEWTFEKLDFVKWVSEHFGHAWSSRVAEKQKINDLADALNDLCNVDSEKRSPVRYKEWVRKYYLEPEAINDDMKSIMDSIHDSPRIERIMLQGSILDVEIKELHERLEEATRGLKTNF